MIFGISGTKRTVRRGVRKERLDCIQTSTWHCGCIIRLREEIYSVREEQEYFDPI